MLRDILKRAAQFIAETMMWWVCITELENITTTSADLVTLSNVIARQAFPAHVRTWLWLCFPLQVVLKNEPVHPFGLAVYGDYIFWTDWVRRAVLRADKFTGGEMKVLRADIPQQPMGIVAVANDTNSCEYIDFVCANVLYMCVCSCKE